MMQGVDVAEVILAQLWVATWQGSLAVVVALAVVRSARWLPAAFHCWMWRLVGLKMLTAFLLVQSIELPVLPSPATHARSEISRSPSNALSMGHEASGQSFSPSLDSAVIEDAVPQGSPVNSRGMILCAISIAWIAGVSWQVRTVALDWRRSIALLQSSERIDEEVQALLAEVAKRVEVAPPRLRQSAMIVAPVVVGIVRPTVLLPAEAKDAFSTSQLSLLMAHELAHIKRCDLMWNWLGVACGILFFFNPFVWMMHRRWRQAQEAACDVVTLRTTAGALTEYADLLLQCSIPGLRDRLGLSSGVSTSFANLKKRIEHMQNLTHVSKRTIVMATSCLVGAAVAGVIPWRLGPATAQVPVANPDPEQRTSGPEVSILKTFEITREQTALAHDGPSQNHRFAARGKQGANARRRTIPGRPGRGSTRGGGIRSSAGGSRQINGQNSSGVGGFASGSTELPNFGIALRVSDVRQPALITVAGDTVAVDRHGKEYEPMTQLGMSRVSVPEFEAAHPDCAGMYFQLSDKRRPDFFAEIRGNLRVTPIKLHLAVFPINKLTKGDRRQTEFGEISIGEFNNEEGWQFEVTTPGPGRNIREVFRYAGMVDVQLVDSRDTVHRPRSKHGSGGGGGFGGSTPAIRELTQVIRFNELEGNVEADRLVVQIRELGDSELIAFTLKNVVLK